MCIFKNIKRYLVDSTERRHIHSLPPDGTSATDTGGILSGSAVDDGVDQDLEGVLGRKCKILKLLLNILEHL